MNFKFLTLTAKRFQKQRFPLLFTTDIKPDNIIYRYEEQQKKHG
jgi:hypothetical protein